MDKQFESQMSEKQVEEKEEPIFKIKVRSNIKAGQVWLGQQDDKGAAGGTVALIQCCIR